MRAPFWPIHALSSRVVFKAPPGNSASSSFDSTRIEPGRPWRRVLSISASRSNCRCVSIDEIPRRSGPPCHPRPPSSPVSGSLQLFHQFRTVPLWGRMPNTNHTRGDASRRPNEIHRAAMPFTILGGIIPVGEIPPVAPPGSRPRKERSNMALPPHMPNDFRGWRNSWWGGWRQFSPDGLLAGLDHVRRPPLPLRGKRPHAEHAVFSLCQHNVHSVRMYFRDQVGRAKRAEVDRNKPSR